MNIKTKIFCILLAILSGSGFLNIREVSAATCSGANCTLNIGNYRLDNNKWGNSGATQSIFTGTNMFGWQWSNSANGWNYPEAVAGTARNCGSNTWSAVFPLQYKNLNTASADIAWKFTQKPTIGSWWNLAFDIYWMDNTNQCDSGKKYNIMIWLHGQQNFANAAYVKDVSDGYNTYAYYRGNRGWPWDVFILKTRTQIPYEPVLNQQYTININIKTLMSAVNAGSLDGNWYIPGIEFGSENSGSLGSTSGKAEISKYNLEINGKVLGISGAVPPPPATICTGESFNYKVVNETGMANVYNSSGVKDTACSNSNHSTAIQCVLNKLAGGKILLVGDFTATDTIYLPSNITWKLCGSITLANGANKILIADAFSGATNINMSGGTYDGNKANQLVSAADDHVIKFSRVTNSHFSDMIIQNAVNDDFTLDTNCNNNTVDRLVGRWAGTGYTGPGATNDGNGLDDKGDHNTWTDCIAEDNYSDNWVIKSRDSTFVRAIGRGSKNAVGFGPFADRNITGNKFYDIKAYNNIHAGFAINMPPKAEGHGYKIENNFIQGEFYNNGTNGMRIKNSTSDGSIKNNTLDILTHNNGAIGFWIEDNKITNTSGPMITCQNATSDLTSQGASNSFNVYHYAGTPSPVINKGSSIVNVVDFTCTPKSVSGIWAVDKFCALGGICGGPPPPPTPTPSPSPSTTPTSTPFPTSSPSPAPTYADERGHYDEFDKPIGSVLYDTVKTLLSIVGGLALLAFMVSGVFYMTSKGNPELYGKAKRMFLYITLGLFAVLLSYAILVSIQGIAF